MSTPHPDDNFIDPLELLGEAPPKPLPPRPAPPKPRQKGPEERSLSGRAPHVHNPAADAQPYGVAAPQAPQRAESKPPQRAEPQPPQRAEPEPARAAPAARGAGHTPVRGHPYPPPPVPPPINEADEAEVLFACHNCGYRLMSQNQYRCAECGREHDLGLLEQWAFCDAESRFTHVLWLVCAALFATALAIAELGVVGRFGAAVAGAWAGFRAAHGRPKSLGYGLAIGAGCAACATVLACRMDTSASYFTLMMISAALLVMSMLTGDDSRPLLARRPWRTLALVLLCASPAMFIAITVVARMTAPASATAAATGTGLNLAPIVTQYLPQAISALYWAFAAWVIWTARRVLFPRADHESD